MKMKSKNILRIFSLLTVLGTVTLFGFQVHSQAANFFIETIESKSGTLHTAPEEYTGPQTVRALIDTFDVKYNRRYSKTEVITSRKGSVHINELAISGEIDTRYPRAEWLQLLLDRGNTIENFDEYAFYLSKRHTLVFLEDNLDLREAGFLGIPLMDDWETYKAAYIDKLVTTKTQIERGKKQLERAPETLEPAEKLTPPYRALNRNLRAIKPLERAPETLEPAEKLTPPYRALNRNLRAIKPLILIR